MPGAPTLIFILKEMRPRQWLKNLLLFAGLCFSRKLLDPDAFRRAFLGFVAFCLISGAVYILNDIVDYQRDRIHPRKRHRPIASGALPIGTAALAGLAIATAGLIIALLLSPYFLMCTGAYLLLMIAYSLSLKQVFLIDTLIIAMGFVIRAVSGVIVLRTPENSVPMTSWFVICVMFLSLLLAFCKRRGERVNLQEDALEFRPVLQLYTLPFVDGVIAVCAAGSILSYTLYASTTDQPWVMLSTLPFVFFGILRYLHLVYNCQSGEAPEVVLATDVPLLGCVILWALCLLFLVYIPI